MSSPPLGYPGSTNTLYENPIMFQDIIVPKDHPSLVDHSGVTLIPPESIAEMIEVVRDVPEMRRLMEMLVVAERERKFVIHVGV